MQPIDIHNDLPELFIQIVFKFENNFFRHDLLIIFAINLYINMVNDIYYYKLCSQLFPAQTSICVILAMPLSFLPSCRLRRRFSRRVYDLLCAISSFNCHVDHVIVQTRLSVNLSLDILPFSCTHALAKYPFECREGDLDRPSVIIS